MLTFHPINYQTGVITKIHFYFFILAGGFTFSCTNRSLPAGKDFKHEFQIEPGTTLELVASEPLVIDPVAFAFDEYHNMYVVEHRGYPDPAEGGPPEKKEGRIAKLIDLNGDGIYDGREEYASELTYPNGIMYWRGGFFVTCAPDIFYLKDTTGDGQADLRNVVLTGFSDTKTAQIRMSHPILGLDGWVYLTGGLNGGQIYSPEFPERQAVTYQSGDGRFHPETLEFQVAGGRSQFGLTMDPFGRRFGCSNRHPVQHIVLEPQQLARNPYLLFNETVQNVSKVEEEAVVYPISGAATTADFIPKLIGRSHQGTFTAASGLLIYADRGLGPANQGNVFICESAQSLVQSQRIQRAGVSFSSQISQDSSEFLACKDEWFRPVFLSHGPRPGLYLADMHRKVIDHPAYIPESMRSDLDYESGKDKGRIYRIVSKDLLSHHATDNLLASDDPIKIARLLASDWEWERAMAFQYLLEHKDTAVTPILERQVREAALSESKVRSLWLLQSLGMLDEEIHLAVFQDSSAGVREQAVTIAGLAERDREALRLALLSRSSDRDMRVRFLTSLALSPTHRDDEHAALSALAKIGAMDGDDPWSRAAVLSSVGTKIESFLELFQDQEIIDSVAYAEIMHDIAMLLASHGSTASYRSFFAAIIDPIDPLTWQIPACLGLLQGLASSAKMYNGSFSSPLSFLTSNLTPQEKTRVDLFLNQVVKIVTDRQQPMKLREEGILILGHSSQEVYKNPLYSLMLEDRSPDIQSSIIQALTFRGEEAGVNWLLDRQNWPSYSPQIRALLVNSLLSREIYIRMLLEAIKEDIVQPSEISASNRERLMSHKDAQIVRLSKSLFGELISGNRIQVYEKYRVTWKPGQAALGKKVFHRACAVCHTYAGQGGQVGPDLTGVKNQPVDALLLHTLVPNYEVYPNYQAMTIELNSGVTSIGWLKAETNHAITLMTAAGKEEILLKSQIKSIRNTGQSLMPDGLEQSITATEMNDLITFLKSG